MTSKFTVRNEGFICKNCRKDVAPLKGSCRNHCPFCLTSMHVDINPGDRLNPCKGIMNAVGYKTTGHKGLILFFKCCSCGELKTNVAATDAPEQSDDYDKILSLGTL